jgi:putative ABC transport system permease protein
MFRLALASLWNRRTIALLTVFSIALSVALLLGVEKLRRDVRASFANTISGVDLIVGARTGSIQLLLYSVFRIGNATNNITWDSYQRVAQDPDVAWTVPFSLGDSHRGYRVLGTTVAYFERYRFARSRRLTFQTGAEFQSPLDTVLGATVAEKLGYSIGDEVVLAHGAGDVSLVKHKDEPFRVVGILQPTGTPVDRTVHISLRGMDLIHENWRDGRPLRAGEIAMRTLTMGEQRGTGPQAITASLVGLKSRIAVFRVQRRLNEFRGEPLLAILPGVALQELWSVMGIAENALRAVAGMVVVTGILGMLVVILASLEARRREMAILRSVGARPIHVFFLFATEAALLSACGVIVGTLLHYLSVLVARPVAQELIGLHMPFALPTVSDLALLGIVTLAGMVVGIVPAVRAYCVSLSDGMSMRF